MTVGFSTRPLIVEFAGTPKAGKGTLIEVVHKYFRRRGWKVHRIEEGARVCPFDKSHRTAFAAWGVNRVINELLNSALIYEGLYQLVLLDRGLLDACAFFELLAIEERISPSQSRLLKEYALFPEWAKNVDLIFLLTVPPNVALLRESDWVLSDEGPGLYGRIMNPETLRLLNSAYASVLHEFPVPQPVIHYESERIRVGELHSTIVEQIEGRLTQRFGMHPGT